MFDDGTAPPMTPDDFAALMAVAGPLFQESRRIESYTSDSPIPNARLDYGSSNIKRGLEQAQQLVQAHSFEQQRLAQQHAYVQPSMQPVAVPPPVHTHPQQVFIPQSQVVEQPQEQQIEFNFNPSSNDVTNDLLKEISKKLTTIVKLLEVKEVGEPVPKLKVKTNAK